MGVFDNIGKSTWHTVTGAACSHVWLLVAICVSLMALFVAWHHVQSSERVRALRRLTQLSADDVEAYHRSYQQIFEDQTMVSSLRDYTMHRPPAPFRIRNGDSRVQSRSTVDCYQVLNLLCALGNVKKMYIPKCMDEHKSLVDNQTLQEEEVARLLFPDPDEPHTSRRRAVLELGCGCGRIAMHVARLTGCHVTGVNIDQSQLIDATEHARENGMADQLTFVHANYNERLPFEDESFDGIYDLGGFTTFISDYDAVFAELHRVLRPGGRIVLSDGVLLDKFDTQDDRHMRLLAKARPVMAGGSFIHYKYFEDIARRAGFRVEQSGSGDAQTRGTRAPDLPVLEREHAHFGWLQWAVRWGVRLCVLPEHMNGLLERVRDGGEELVTMEREGLVTMDWDYVFVKDGMELHRPSAL